MAFKHFENCFTWTIRNNLCKNKLFFSFFDANNNPCTFYSVPSMVFSFAQLRFVNLTSYTWPPIITSSGSIMVATNWRKCFLYSYIVLFEFPVCIIIAFAGTFNNHKYPKCNTSLHGRQFFEKMLFWKIEHALRQKLCVHRIFFPSLDSFSLHTLQQSKSKRILFAIKYSIHLSSSKKIWKRLLIGGMVASWARMVKILF